MELKFRAWDNNENNRYDSVRGKGHFVNHERFKVSFDGLLYDISTQEAFNRQQDITITQYIGLQDKNKKDVYEGDIIAFMRHGEVLVKRVIEFDEDERAFNSPANLGVAGTPWNIIGNIYESPELLDSHSRTT